MVQLEPRLTRPPLRLVCSEIWGGNRAVDNPVELPGLRGLLYSRPCHGGRGGDVHYLSVCGSGLLSRICVADVVGHGEAVASVSHEMHVLLREAMNHRDQRRVLQRLNVRLEEMGLKAMTTAAAFTYYPPDGRLSFSYAGHPPAWWYEAATGRWRRLSLGRGADEASNLPLGVDPAASFSRDAMRVRPGDRLFVLTDGILEAPGRDADLFGDERLERFLVERNGAPLDDIAGGLLAALDRHVGGLLHHDDVTFLLIEFDAGPRGPAVWHAVRNRVRRPRGNTEAFEAAQEFS